MSRCPGDDRGSSEPSVTTEEPDVVYLCLTGSLTHVFSGTTSVSFSLSLRLSVTVCRFIRTVSERAVSRFGASISSFPSLPPTLCSRLLGLLSLPFLPPVYTLRLCLTLPVPCRPSGHRGDALIVLWDCESTGLRGQGATRGPNLRRTRPSGLGPGARRTSAKGVRSGHHGSRPTHKVRRTNGTDW